MSQREETTQVKVPRHEIVCCPQDTTRIPIWQKFGAWAWADSRGIELEKEVGPSQMWEGPE